MRNADWAISSLYFQRPTICEERRCSARVYEHYIVVATPATFANEGDQSRQTFAGVYRIEDHRLQMAGQLDRINRRGMGNAIGRSGVTGNHLDVVF